MRFNPFLVIGLSLVPGLAHVYIRQYKKAVGLLVISAVVLSSWIFSKSLTVKLLMTMVYVFTAVSGGIESYEMARGGRARFTDTRWYISLLLLCTGFSSLPLLWQSDRFSRGAKIAWTVAVPVLAVLFFTLLGVYWNKIDMFLETWVKNH